jgi:hypothetical protein
MTQLVNVQIMVKGEVFFTYAVHDASLDAVLQDARATYPEASSIVLAVQITEEDQ